MPANASTLPRPDPGELPGLLQRRPFRMLCYTRFLSRLAQNSLNFALVLLIVEETQKAFISSLLVLALVIPSTVFGIIAGAAADIFPKRLLILLGDLARAAVCVFFFRGEQDIAAYFAVAIVLASLVPFTSTAEGAVQPLLVERDELTRANAISHAVGSAAQLLGLGVLTPFALRVLDAPDVLFLVAAGLFVAAGIAGLFIGRVRPVRRTDVGGDARSGPWWTTGWRTMRADPAVMHAAIELTLLSMTLIILGGLIPTYISDTLDLPVDVGAVILLPAVVGVVLGLRIAGFLAHRIPHGLLSSIGFAAFVVSLVLVTFVNPLSEFLSGYGWFSWLDTVSIGRFDGGGVCAMAFMLPLGFAFAIVSVAGQTVLNDRVPLYLQGRVGATQAAMAALASSIPVVVAGLMADALGVTAVMATVAVGIGFAAVMNLRQPLRREPEAELIIG